jgi:hypothetical protein
VILSCKYGTIRILDPSTNTTDTSFNLDKALKEEKSFNLESE